MIVLKIFLREQPISIGTENIVRSGDTLIVHTKEKYYMGIVSALYRSRIVIEIPKAALESVNAIQYYAEVDRPQLTWV